MIARTWHARAAPEQAAGYQRHFTTQVIPNLASIAGHRGAWLLRREVDGAVEFVAVTLWDSLASIKRFAGDDPTVAHVEPEGRAALASFDERATHYEIACSTIGEAGGSVACSGQTH